MDRELAELLDEFGIAPEELSEPVDELDLRIFTGNDTSAAYEVA